jgi:hypothetical protein
MTPEDLHRSNYAALYQIVGALAGAAGVLQTDAVERLVTDLNAIAAGAEIDLGEVHFPFSPNKPE